MRGDAEFHRTVCAVGWCERCGSTSQLEAAHIYLKGRFPELRHEPRNALCLCRECHKWSHANGKDWRAWLRETWPGRLEFLQHASGVGLKD